MLRGLLTLCLFATGCGALNDEQLDYLRRDALTRSRAPSTVAALARHASRYADAATLDSTRSASDNVDRIEARLAKLDPTCLTVVRGGATELTVTLKVKCFPDAGTDQLSVFLLRGSVHLDIVSETFAVPAIHLEKGSQELLTFSVDRLPPPDDSYTVDTDILSFKGTAEVDAAGTTLDGSGTHEGEIRFPLAYRMERVRVVPGCGGVQGRLTLGPRDVFVWQGHTRPVEQLLEYGPPGRGTLRVEDRSFDEVLFVSSLCPK